MQLVTVIIPIYNIYEFLIEAIDSVLNQNFNSVEIVIVNDGSDDAATKEIKKICTSYSEKVKLIDQKKTGQALARFNGIKHAKGDYIIFLDADDILMPNSINHLVSTLQNNPGYIASYGTKTNLYHDGKVKFVLPTNDQAVTGNVLSALLKGVPLLSNGNICIKKEFIEKVNFPSGIYNGEDWITWCRLASLGDFIFAGEQLVLKIRTHQNNTSGNVLKKPSLLFKMLDYVFEDSYFINLIGEKKIKEYKTIHRNHINRHLFYTFRDNKQYFRAIKHRILKYFWEHEYKKKN